MLKLLYIALIGILIVIFYDLAGSFLSRSFGFDYSWLMFGYLVIYAFVGFLGSRESVLGASVAAALVGFADATLGWYISWFIGPPTKFEEITIFTIASIVPFVTVLAGVTGLMGAIGSRLVRLK